jgi:Ni/Co efflux regulator RcnB
MRTVLSRRHGWTLAVLLVAAIAVLTTVRLSASAAQAPANASAHPTAHQSTRATARRSAHRTAHRSADRTAHRAAHRTGHRSAPAHHVSARPAVRHPRTATLRVPQPGRLIRTLTGTGPRAIGSLRESRAAVLQWQTSRGPFQLFTSRGVILVTSRAHKGSIGLARGTYARLRVSSPGAWTIRLSRRR